MKIERMDWEDYLRWVKRRLHAGEHGVIIGSTGSGKSILAREVVPMFGRNIVVVDGKGGDDPSLAFPGFNVVRAWPPREESSIMRAISPSRAREPIRVVFSPKKEKMADLARNRDLFSNLLDDLFTRKRARVFTVYFDELGELADPKKMGLGSKVEVLHQQMRYRKGSVITSMQFPTWLPKPAYRETKHRWIFRVMDEDSMKFLASITGHRQEIMPVMQKLRRFEFIHQDIWADKIVISKVRLDRGKR